ncbi:bifunctional acetate--CoA ligase family protein/GNAT family N-acetyltransferase [Vibrio sp. S4M6]|uniref:bifunctional acetate--CoA ligase family protein/GNAT family N-acetyltransferase n=1 Tax=Vibrio sinus TaxID=2946865 RepID=UPI00202A34FF|nr:bifunctional acetate--CoA ligase family protein/GNAT family N-acetyltransferase [Vibrio sinus]MCL9783227.1 bifunctional acetate--CoA ligase family protein/GNAT family N-acetyltransferase [Vibrio sinus]
MKNLEHFFRPKSVAVIGASTKAGRPGNVVMNNLLHGGFDGVIMPVSPKYKSVCGVLAYAKVAALPLEPDIAVLCTKAERNIKLFEALAKKGCKVVIVLSADISNTADDNVPLQDKCLDIAKRAKMRVLGPNSLGIMLPWIRLNASFSPIPAEQGKIAFVSQSAAVCTTILDWAKDNQIGFSAVISLGNAYEISFADMLDWLSSETKTTAILLYVDSIYDARRFLSAARAASRNRRVLVLKSGRTKMGQAAVKLHTGGEDSLDIVYDSAIRRAGMLRVMTTHELFAAVETLTHSVPLRGERIAFITNGGGQAIMAVDTLAELGGKLAKLDEPLLHELSSFLPYSWSKANPIDIAGDSDPQRYIQTLNAVMNSDITDTIVIMHSPSSIAPGVETARRLIDFIKNHPKRQRFNILTNWCGEYSAKQARNLFSAAGIPTYRTPESVSTAFMHLVDYRRNQKHLMETPSTAQQISSSEVDKSIKWLKQQLQVEPTVHLETHQIGYFLEHLGFNVLPTWVASTVDESLKVANNIGYPVAVKLRSPEIAHKSDVHGVMLNLQDDDEVANASRGIFQRAKRVFPSANIEGFVIQGMAETNGGEELRVKVKNDEVFGPVILIGQGGSEWDESRDAEAALPPLNSTLARYLIIRAIKTGKIRYKKLIEPIDIKGLSQFLVRLSQMVIACPQVFELDIHPLLVKEDKFTILDARLTLRSYQGEAQKRLAIRPYPVELEQKVQLKDNTLILLRPVLPEDEPLHSAFVKGVSKEDLYKRFFTEVGELNHEALAKLTQIDYDREMAFVAVHGEGDGKQILGVSRALIDPDNEVAEFAILIRSDLKRNGLGKILMEKIIQYCNEKGTKKLIGITMPSNQGMLKLASRLGFTLNVQFEDGTADMTLKLN